MTAILILTATLLAAHTLKRPIARLFTWALGLGVFVGAYTSGSVDHIIEGFLLLALVGFTLAAKVVTALTRNMAGGPSRNVLRAVLTLVGGGILIGGGIPAILGAAAVLALAHTAPYVAFAAAQIAARRAAKKLTRAATPAVDATATLPAIPTDAPTATLPPVLAPVTLTPADVPATLTRTAADEVDIDALRDVENFLRMTDAEYEADLHRALANGSGDRADAYPPYLH